MSKPKRSTYKKSEADKDNDAISMANKKYFRENYLPKQKEFIERSFKEEPGLMSMAEGRAQADTMQALTQNPNRRAVGAVDAQADLASAASAQQLQGTAQGLVGARSDQVVGIKSANQMASQTAAGLSQASKITTTDTLNRATAKQTRNSALIGAATKLGVQAGNNYSQYRAAESVNTQEIARNTDASGNLKPGGDYIPMTENANIFKIVTGRGLG